MTKVYEEIVDFARQFQTEKVVLFGSRARGTHQEKSDIDIAVYGCLDFDKLQDKLNEELWSLLELDIINMDAAYISEDLKREIQRDGVVLYEKI
ncbi:MAG: nucleotidyltransferase domain-containing protein [Lachnospiraceae bacterium]|nr:nucleotidyltransferase domain-containing protein [Lachnospiraceae bacterium]